MSANATILITVPPPALLQGLKRHRPDLAVAPLDEGLPEAVAGPVWCFVDWLLPDRSGLEMVRTLREARATRDSHITMVLESPEPDDKRRALRAGADDYLVGPLDAKRLLERLATYEAKPASAPAAPRRRLAHGELVLDLNAHQVRYQGRLLTLRPNELRLLAHFIEHPDQVFSRAALIERIGKDDEVGDERTVDVWVGRLRRALVAQGATDPLRTVRSAGYVLDSLPEIN